jgi:hypothetical protein
MHPESTAGSLKQGLTGRCPATQARQRLGSATRSCSPRVSAEWMALALVAVAILATAVGFAAENLPDEVRTRTVRVEQGDSLWTLASANPIQGLNTAETAELIRQTNEMQDSVVHTGQLIRVPDTSRLQGSVAWK